MQEVAAALGSQNITVNAHYVSKIKSTSRKAKVTSPKKATSEAKSSSTKQWTFPKNTLEEAIRIPKAIEENYAGNPMRAADLSKVVGFKRVSDWRFLDLLSRQPVWLASSAQGRPPW